MITSAHLWPVLTVGLLLGCGGGDSAPPDANLGADQTITAFSATHVYFGAENQRVIDLVVDFPPAGELYRSITLDLTLACPEGGCDFWDRLGWLAVVEDPDGPAEREIEVLRFVTPYRVGGSWRVDVTDLRPLLTGVVTMRVFIDTWVGPGSAYGAGWLVDASFDFEGGPPPRPVAEIIPLWSPHGRTYGDPAETFSTTTHVTISPPPLAALLRSFVTGHGQGNAENCAEFCSKRHWFEVAGQRFERQLWRNDCPETAVPDQAGTWEYPRTGWCPGAVVRDWSIEVTDAIAAGGDIAITYDADPYVNTCRPDANPCTGCVAGVCDYNDGSHTRPFFEMSSLLILYR